MIPSLKHTLTILNNFLENGGNGFQRRVMWISLHSSLPLIFILGVGNTKANEGEDNQDQDPKQLASHKWKWLLDEKDGLYSLKPWEEVEDMSPNKDDIAYAFREVVRQAWGK